MEKPKKQWKCAKCGLCCINTVITRGDLKLGMFLLPHEKLMFPERYVYPLYGVGLKGKARPRPQYIFAYQNISKPCIYYDEYSHECRIYDDRPLVCRVFPLEGLYTNVILHRECPMVASAFREGEQCLANEIEGLEQEKIALQHIQAYYYTIFILNAEGYDTTKTWIYDYVKKKWIRVTKETLVKVV